MTDEEIMSQVKSGDLDIATDLYDKYSKKLYNFFVKISSDREISHDLLQNTFLRVLKYRHTYSEKSSFQAWMFQIARNVFADYLRREKMKISDFEDVENYSERISEESNEIKEGQNRGLEYSLSKLSPESREILVLSRYQGMKYEQIADVMDLTVPAVKSKVHRAIKKLRDHYFQYERI